MNHDISFQDLRSQAVANPLNLVIGLAIFAAAAGGGVIAHAASTSWFVLFIISLFYVRRWPALWRGLGSEERLILLALALYFLSAVASYYNVDDPDEYLKDLGKYARFLLVVPVYLLLSKTTSNLFSYLLAGAIASGPVYLGAALISLVRYPGTSASGAYHHITFGDMAMLSALFMMTVLVMNKASKAKKTAMAISIVCLLIASLLSQARGAWLALPFGLLVLLPVALHGRGIKLRTIVLALLALAVVVAFSPAKEIVTTRVQQAVTEVKGYQTGENYRSSVGSRIAMWHVAWLVWQQYPVVGTGPGDFDLDFAAKQKEGLYPRNQVHTSTHNIYFQALATTGLVGFVILCLAVFIFPLRLFYRANREKLNVASVSGVVMLTAYAVFGLTESWTLRGPALTVYLMYLAVLVNTVVRQRQA